jgi:hypothetical protein
MSQRKVAFLLLLIMLVCTTRASAQHHADHPGTTVQLPTFSFFTVSTTVSVPDQGSTSLGGVNSVSNGSTAYGPSFPGNRASGASSSAGGMSVHVTIHDFESMDAETLRQAGMTPAQIDALRLGSAQKDASAPASVADVRRQQLAAVDKKQQEATEYYRRGQTAESEGKGNVAKIYFQMAARRASGELKAEIQRHLDGPALARSAPRPPQQ